MTPDRSRGAMNQREKVYGWVGATSFCVSYTWVNLDPLLL
jgi:hypothetical protein